MKAETKQRERMQRTRIPIVQNYLLIWLDSTIDESNEDCLHSLEQLRRIVNTINIYTDPQECVDFIEGIKNENVFIIVSGFLGSETVPRIHHMPQINSFYVFCGNKSRHEHWAREWNKVKGVYTDIQSICEVLQQHTQQCDRDSTSITITNARNPNELEPTFMYTTLFKEIILEIDYDDNEINHLAEQCRLIFLHNKLELKVISEFEQHYHKHTPIWWYTRQCFLYQMLNRALRTFDTNTIVTMGFFIQGLHQRIEQLHSKQQHLFNKTFTVYRGQGLSNTDFQKLQGSSGGLLSFNNFLSTSRKREVSYVFASDALQTDDHVGILFRMQIQPSIESSPFAVLLDKESYFEEQEQEILFSMNSIFRIGELKRLEEKKEIFEVELVLTSNTDKLWQGLTERMRDELSGSSGWHRLGHLLLQSGDLNNAEELYQTLLERTSEDDFMEIAFLNNQLGHVKNGQGQHETALQFYEKDLEITKISLPPTHPDLATSYSNIGRVYSDMGEYSKALEYYEKDLEITKISLPPTHPSLATSYNNIGLVYFNMGEYSKALDYYEKAHKIRETSLPPTHPSLATSYCSLGGVYSNMGEYSKALEYYEKSHKIYEASLPPTHPSLATSYSNIGGVYSSMGEYSKALEYYEKSHKIYEASLPPTHPSLARSYCSIGGVYSNMGEYSKALEYHEKDLEITKISLPPTHPDLAATYSNIGQVYSNMGEYPKALEYYEKAHKIYETSLPPTHPGFASVYSGLGRTYRSMKVYSTSLSYFEKTLDIFKSVLPENHPNLAITYSNIGDVKRVLGDHTTAHSFLQRALDIQESVTCDRTSLARTYNYFGELFRERKDHSAALDFYKKALKISEKLLPATHPDLAVSQHNFAKVYKEQKQFKLAYEYAQRAVEIAQQKLPEKHPDIVEYRETVSQIRKKL